MNRYLPPYHTHYILKEDYDKGRKTRATGIEIEKKDDIHRGCCNNNGMQEAGKETFHGSRGGGVFGTTIMEIATEKEGGGYQPPPNISKTTK